MSDWSISPSSVWKRTLSDGTTLPAIGLGTFGSDHASPGQVAQAVSCALELGYRLIDCAACYGNEAEIGRALKQSGVPREELFLISKVWNDMHGYDRVRTACEKSLRDLGLDELDLYLVHWPIPNSHDPGCDGDSRNPLARPYRHEEFMETWRGMEALVDAGLVRRIGVSNVTPSKLRPILRDARIRPAANEMELHPSFQQEELLRLSVDEGILPIGYCPLGSPNRPERDRAPEDVVDTALPEVLAVAKSTGLTPAEVCLKWAVSRGQVAIPFSLSPEHLRSNLACATGEPFSSEEMQLLSGAERNCRLIKGQVFLWEGATDWRDLWI